MEWAFPADHGAAHVLVLLSLLIPELPANEDPTDTKFVKIHRDFDGILTTSRGQLPTVSIMPVAHPCVVFYLRLQA